MLRQTILATVLLVSMVAKADKTFVYCSEGSPETFNPHLASDGTTFNASSHPVYDTLIKFKHDSVDLEPGLAESWKADKSGLKYTFKLRKGVKWHSNAIFTPTRDFNADDVVYSFAVQADQNNPLAIKNGTYEYYKSMEMDKIIKAVNKIDDYTVEFVLSQPNAPFLANIAMDFASIMSKEYAEFLVKNGKGLETENIQPIGTGPFIFKSYQKDTIIRFTANPNYWGGKPKIDNLVFAITPDASVRLQKLKAGECQFIAYPAPSDLPAIEQNKTLKVMGGDGLNIGYLAFNVEKKPFDNIKVRQAINYALNRKSYINAIYLGQAEVAKNPIPPSIWSYNNSVKDYDYNPEKAKQLLKEAGLPNGFETELWAMPVARPYNPAGKKLAELMQADLAKVGVKVKIMTYDWPVYIEKSRKGEHAMLQMGWTGDNGDPDNFLAMLLSCASIESGSNNARWCYKPYDDLVAKAKVTTDKKKRTELYKQAQVIFKEQAPWVTIAHGKAYRAMSAKVTGYHMQPFGGDIFDQVDIK